MMSDDNGEIEVRQPTTAEILQREIDRLDDFQPESPLKGTGLESDPDESLAEWYVDIMQVLKDRMDRADVIAAAIKASALASMKAIAWKYGGRFKTILDRKVAENRKGKYHDFPTGRGGYRKKPDTLIVENEQDAVEWCALHAPECLSPRVSRTALKKRAKAGESLPPGVRLHEGKDEAYPMVRTPSLEEEVRAMLPEADE
jgi:hypothetical protein